jgi:pilus assembly protein CpaE
VTKEPDRPCKTTFMRAVIVNDRGMDSAKVRQALIREGVDCPLSSISTIDLAPQELIDVQPDLVFFLLSSNPEREIALLQQVRRNIKGHALVVGPLADSRLILRVLREGADYYLDEADLDSEVKNALLRLRSEAGTQANLGRLIALLAPSGGGGSSTLAANLAALLAKQHSTCALLDLKLEAADLAALLNLKPTHTLADLCANAAKLDQVMFERSLVKHGSGIHLLAAPRNLADIVHVKPETVCRTLALARAAFGHVVADLDHSFRDEQIQVLKQADILLLILRLEFASLRNARRALDYLEYLGIGKGRIRLVANRYGQPKEVPAAKAEEALGMEILHYIPDDPRTVNRANNNGVPFVLDNPSAKVSRMVTQLALSVNGKKNH